ncbi:hypothetical protein Tco_1060226 [Tanacetum coccineum]
MYLTSSRPDIMFAVYACARYQVNPKVSHIHAMKRICRYLKGQPKLGLWYPKDSPFDLVAYTDSDYPGASSDRKSTIGGCQFLGSRLISWQCKKQTVVANSTTEAEYVAASSCCGQRVGENKNRKRDVWNKNRQRELQSDLVSKRIERSVNAARHNLLLMFEVNAARHNLLLLLEVNAAMHNLLPLLEVNAARHNLLLLLKVNAAKHKLTTAVKTVNGEVQLQALVDGKKIIITEASVRCDLQLNDEEGTDYLPNATIFEELTRIGAKTTTWNEFSSTIASAIICLAINQKFNFSKYIFESMVKNLENVSGNFLMYPRFVQVFLEKQLEGMLNHKRIYVTPSHTKKIFGNMRRVGKGFSRRDTPLFPTMMVQAPQEQGEDKAVNEEMDDSLVRAATTAFSLEVEQDNGNIDKIRSKATPNEPSSLGTSSSGVNTPRSDEDRLKLNKLMELCTNLQNRVLDLENTKTAQAQKIDDIDKDAKITLVNETQGRYDDEEMFDTCVLDEDEVLAELEVTIKDEKSNVVEEPSESITTTPTLTTTTATRVTAASTRPKAKGLVINEEEQATTPIVSSQQPSQVKAQDKGKGIMVEELVKIKKKDQISLDEELTFKLQAKEEGEERLAREKAQKEEEANIVA